MRKIKPIYLDMIAVSETVALSEASVQKLVRENRLPKPRLVSDRLLAIWL